jgi:diaminohydroxyphosphoribosylaminopyrimidine deaminase/5-amino-6-(5-phosphoribosylamino)uracil reductase
MNNQSDLDRWQMRRALELAAQGQGYVEPNPMVGCVVVQGAEIIGEGWHRRFGEAHAEINALKLAGDRAAGATLYVTLEPCCHTGKTPPCTEAVLKSGVRRVVVAQADPFPQVSGGGLAQLQAAGVEVELGVLESEARRLNRPYLTLLEQGRPWVIAKWAMTLDGKTATRTGSSQWISNQRSRAIVHQIRGRVDAVVVGRRTAEIDDPQLTARPPGPRTPVRIVIDTKASLSSESQLVRTARDTPVLVAVGWEAPAPDRSRLENAGCEVFVCDAKSRPDRLRQLFDELGRRRLTNVLIEGGGQLTGSLLAGRMIDEIHAFIAPKVVGGSEAPSPMAGQGMGQMSQALQLDEPQVEQLDGDIYIHGRVLRG